MKICLCGSTRYMDQFHDANVALSLAGHIVYSVATSTKGDFQPTTDQKLALDCVHLGKILESDCIFVVGQQEDGSMYIGESTRREMMFAAAQGKEIYFWDRAKSKDIVGSIKDFESAIKAAATTNLERAELKAKREAQRAEMLRGMGIDPDKLSEHTGEPDCPACEAEREGHETDASHTH